MLVFNRVRVLVNLLVVAITFGTLGLLSAAPAQASDMSGPVLVSQSVTWTNLNLRDGPATINTTIRLADATGVQTPTMIASWVNPDPFAWGGGQSQGFGSMTLVSGTMQDGIWKHTITIPQGAATGQWEVTLYPLRDTWGNNSTFFKTLATVTVTDKAPPTEVSPPAVTFSDKDGTAADTYTIPAATGVDYLVGGAAKPAGTYPGAGTVTVTAKAITDYILTAGATASWTGTFKTTPNPVTPAAVVFTDKDGTAADTYTIPATTGVDYLVGGTAKPAGTYPGTGTVTVTAKAKTDYILTSGATASWTATFSAAVAPTVPAAPAASKRLNDFTNDGKTDVIARDASGRLWLYPGTGTGDWLKRIDLGGGWNVMTSIVSAGDFNGDSKADVIARDTGGQLWLYPGTGNGDWSKRQNMGGGWNVMTSIVAPGDFNADGRPDLIARDSSGELWLYPNNGAGDWLKRVDLGPGWNTMSSIVAPGDFNADGKVDLVARDVSGRLWLYPGNGKNEWFKRVDLGPGWNTMNAITSPGDMNSDGRPDVIARDTTGELWLYPNNGKGDWNKRIDLGPGWNPMTAIL